MGACPVVEQAKIALTQVQKVALQKRGHRFKETKKFKKSPWMSRASHFGSIPTNISQKILIFFLKSNQEGIFNFNFEIL